ncbi:MAG: UDP-N-acetylglucosamine--N-acetylmuramyl-(pentapeptide) pyrophosphoryl-undecaprenol N-acetylglucosamine transferase [Planctomycetota bacterium]
MTTPRTYLFLGGGTGGHIYPGLAIAEQLTELAAGTPRRIFVTSDRPIDTEIVVAAIGRGEADAHDIISAKPFSPRPLKLLRCLASWGGSVREVRSRITAERAQKREVVAISLGGFVAAPAAQACRVENVPVIAVQLDAAKGLANKFITARAQKLVAVDTAPDDRGWTIVPPLIRSVALPSLSPQDSRSRLGLDPERPTLLVIGGSQGAGTLNDFVPELIRVHADILDARRWQILHLAGPNRDAEVRGLYQRALGADAANDVIVLPSLTEMGHAWGAAELAIGRGGAGTIAEARASGTKIVVFPYPFHRDRHQALNARRLEEAGLATILHDHISPAANVREHAETLRQELAASGLQAGTPTPGPRTENGARAIAEIAMEPAT